MHRKILVIHHSHTDIGYTNLQNRIEKWQIDFIHQALDIIDDDINAGFKWNCESFWVLERFLQQASQQDICKFIKAVRSNRIGISGNYLNFNELIDYDLLFKLISKAKIFGQSIGMRIDSAMTADINGFGWGYSQALYDNNIRNLFTCIHEHHGKIPLNNRHQPFWWRTPKDDKILVWNGEHYHFGNELGLVPAAVSSYIIKDECDAEMIYSDHWSVAKIRIPRLFRQLEKAGYEYDFIPVTASGLRTDNSPPNHKILRAIEKWNNIYGDQYVIEMVTLSEFFDILRAQIRDIPIYKGDWPDWWSDGTACAPEYTRTFRQSQRDLCYYKSLLRQFPEIVSDDVENVEYDLALYAEHTFGHADSVANPWHFMQQNIASRKKAYAVKAYESVQNLIDDAHRQMGMCNLKSCTPLHYMAVNPLDVEVGGLVRLQVGHYEYHELKLDKGARIIDRGTKNEYPYQIINTPNGMEYVIYLKLNSADICNLKIIPSECNCNSQNEPIESRSSLENEFVQIKWQENNGIISWFDKLLGKELINPENPYMPFTPVYEVTPVSEKSQMCTVRGKMDKNRKGVNVVRSAGKLTGSRNNYSGQVFSTVTLNYELPGINYCELDLVAYNNEPRVDVSVKMHKNSVWEPENVYLSLPFSIRSDASELWIAKSGAIIRPRTDQIPGTLIDYYSIQDGLAFISKNYGILILTPDTNLLHIGGLEHREREMFDPGHIPAANQPLYSWLMTNYWETNFEADLGGFYEFRYSICWGDKLNDAENALKICRNHNIGIRCFRVE